MVMNNAVPKNLVPMERLEEAAECLRTLAHPHRLRMVQMLLHGEYMVGELADACGIPSHMASEHLRLMKDRGLLAYERRGRCIYYRVAEQGLASIMGCVENRFGVCGVTGAAKTL
jgi:DNA-binding transcriptional ArsR family regulator